MSSVFQGTKAQASHALPKPIMRIVDFKLKLALETADIKTVKELLNDLNVNDDILPGKSALHVAILSPMSSSMDLGDLEKLVSFLLNLGAKIEIPVREMGHYFGKTTPELAVLSGKLGLLPLFMSFAKKTIQEAKQDPKVVTLQKACFTTMSLTSALCLKWSIYKNDLRVSDTEEESKWITRLIVIAEKLLGYKVKDNGLAIAFSALAVNFVKFGMNVPNGILVKLFDLAIGFTPDTFIMNHLPLKLDKISILLRIHEKAFITEGIEMGEQVLKEVAASPSNIPPQFFEKIVNKFKHVGNILSFTPERNAISLAVKYYQFVLQHLDPKNPKDSNSMFLVAISLSLNLLLLYPKNPGKCINQIRFALKTAIHADVNKEITLGFIKIINVLLNEEFFKEAVELGDLLIELISKKQVDFEVKKEILLAVYKILTTIEDEGLKLDTKRTWEFFAKTNLIKLTGTFVAYCNSIQEPKDKSEYEQINLINNEFFALLLERSVAPIITHDKFAFLAYLSRFVGAWEQQKSDLIEKNRNIIWDALRAARLEDRKTGVKRKRDSGKEDETEAENKPRVDLTNRASNESSSSSSVKRRRT